jgi:hypothetical protein
MKMRRPVRSLRDLADRTSGERLIVWGLRASIANDRQCACCAISHVFSQFGVGDAASALGRIADVLGKAAHTFPNVHRAGCRCLSGDEALFVELAAAAQAGDMRGVRAGLGHWLPPEKFDWAQMPFVGLARIFAGAGLLLPRRGIEASSHAFPRSILPPTLH